MDSQFNKVYKQLLIENKWKNRILPAAVGLASGVLHGLQYAPKHEPQPELKQEPAQYVNISKKEPAIINPIKTKEASKEAPKETNAPLITKDFINYVIKHEGFHETAYWDYDQYSIGYGTKATPQEVKQKKKITKDQAYARLIKELNEHKDRVISAAKTNNVQFNNNQISALISFDYNTGRGRKAIFNYNTPHAIAQYIATIIHAGGKPQSGLIERRATEIAQFLGITPAEAKQKYFK